MGHINTSLSSLTNGCAVGSASGSAGGSAGGVAVVAATMAVVAATMAVAAAAVAAVAAEGDGDGCFRAAGFLSPWSSSPLLCRRTAAVVVAAMAEVVAAAAAAAAAVMAADGGGGGCFRAVGFLSSPSLLLGTHAATVVLAAAGDGGGCSRVLSSGAPAGSSLLWLLLSTMVVWLRVLSWLWRCSESPSVEKSRAAVPSVVPLFSLTINAERSPYRASCTPSVSTIYNVLDDDFRDDFPDDTVLDAVLVVEVLRKSEMRGIVSQLLDGQRDFVNPGHSTLSYPTFVRFMRTFAAVPVC